MKTLLTTTTDEFYGAEFDAYAYARYLLLLPAGAGQAARVLRQVPRRHEGPDRRQTALEAVLGEDLATFEPKWRKWVLALQGDNR